MSTKFLSPGWRMPRNANQSKSSNYSLDFSGAQYISIDTNGSFPFGLMNTGVSSTVSLWAKLDTLSQSNVVLFEQRNTTPLARYVIWFQNSTSTINFYANANKQSQAVNANQWYHIVATLDGTNAKFYVDGSEVGTALTYTPTNTNQILELGRQPNNTQFFNGQITEVSIFDYALSASQVTTLWGGGTSVSNPMALSSPPIAYYPLGKSAGGFVGGSGTWLTENNAIGDYVFDNINSSAINTPYNLTATSNITVAIWFKTTTNAQSNKYLFSYGNSSSIYDFRLNGTDSVQPIIKLAGVQRYPSISFNYADGNWHQYVVNYDGSHIKVYIDGILKNKSSYSGDLSVSTNNFVFANLSSTSSGGVVGEVSNCTIHTATLTDGNVSEGNVATGEIATFYNYGSPIKTLSSIPKNSNLDLWYKLDASEVYNSSTTEWSIDNNQNPSAYPSSLDFNGTNDYITLPTITLTDNWSVSVWMNQTTLKLRAQAVGASNAVGTFWAYAGQILSGGGDIGKLAYYNGTGYITLSNNRLDDGLWHNWIITYDHSTTTLKCYIDGQENYSDTYNAGTGNTIDRISNNFASNYWLGQLSNISVWNTALTSTQITELYNNGTPSNLSSHSVTSNLVSWYKLNNTTTGIEDSKGSNNGTNNGATEYTGFVNTLVGDSSGMSQANLVQSDLQTVAPYSKYAMNFDSADSDYVNIPNSTDFNLGTSFTISGWFNFGSNKYQGLISFDATSGGSPRGWFLFQISSSNDIKLFDGTTALTLKTSYTTTNKWDSFIVTYDGTDLVFYINGTQESTQAVSIDLQTNGNDGQIGNNQFASGRFFDGKMSNIAFWNTALTSAQVSEVYNESLPSNLNSHSAYSNLVSWWQLGENSSFDGNNWICADEKGTNNGTSANMTVANLTNGVGTTANGVSSGMSEGNLVGDAPYSTANAISSGMSVVSRLTDVPPTPPFLLDDYPSDAAYSLRKLSSTYTGNAIRVRRTNDNTEQNIGFNGNYLDESALSNFCGSNDGRVVTWYDQSGSGFNITQTSAFFQPIIYDGTSGIIKNFNKPAVKFATSKLIYNANPLMGNSQPYTAVVVVVPNNTSGGRQAFYDLGYSNSASEHGVESSTFKTNSGQGSSVITTVSDNTHYLSFGVFDGTSTNFTINGTLHNVTSGGTRTNQKITLGSYERGSYYLNNGFIHEFIFYTSDKTSEKTEIQNNINTYYSIY